MTKLATRPLPPPTDTPASLSQALTQVNIFLNDLRGFVESQSPPAERKSRAERKSDGVLPFPQEQDDDS